MAKGAPAPPRARRKPRTIQTGGGTGMIAHRHGVVAALVGLVALPRLAPAHQTLQRQVDSLAAEIQVLKGRIDSLRARLGRAPGVVPAPAGKDEGGTDELAPLRA